MLLSAVGENIAKLLQVEAAFICSCASAGITLMAAACMTGIDKTKIQKLPKTDDIPHEFIVFREHRNPFDLESAIDYDTVAIYFTYAWFIPGKGLSLKESVDIAHKNNIYVIVDAAAQLPPCQNLTDICDHGVDLVVFSGGKALCGHQSSGLLLGRKELTEACAMNSSPNVNCIGRGMKAGKEEIMGLLKAVELYTKRNHTAYRQIWEDRVAYLVTKLKKIPGLRITRAQHSGIGDHAPFAVLTWDINELPISPTDSADQLLNGEHPIAVRLMNFSLHSEIRIHVHTLKDGEELIIAKKNPEIFNGIKFPSSLS